MFKLWKKNNNKETTVKTKSKRKVAVLAFAAAALACLTGASLMFGLNAANNRGGFGGMSGIDGIHNTGSLAGAAIPTTADKPTYDYEIHLKGTAPEMATLWKEAVGLSGKVLVVLENNWTADATTGFGSDTGFTDNNGLDIPAGKNITIDLNGKKLDRNSAAAVTSSVIRVPAGATLTVNDASNGGQITGGNTATYGGGIHVNGGTLTLNGGTITGNKAGSTKNGEPVGLGVAVRSSGTFTMNGGKITANTCESSLSIGGGGVSVNTGALFVMNGGEISDHDVVWGVGINVLNGSTLIMNGGVVKNNTANGGAIVNVSGGTVDGTSSGAAANSTFIMNGGTFTDNTVHNIGCIGVSGRASFTMNGGKITKTTNTIGAGDAIYAAGSSTSSKDASVVINGGEISYNTCVSGAGGIYVGGNGGAVLSINGGLICHNEGADGGGVAVGRYSDFYMYGGTISENSVSHEGGGICLITKNDTGVAFAGGSVINNTSVAGGGGIYVPANLEMNIRGGLVVTGNTSGAVGSKITQNVYLSGASALFKTRGYIDSYGSAPQIGITYNGSVPYNFIMDITTAASHYNDGNFIGAYFFSDDPNRVVSEEGGNNYPKLMAVGSSKVTTLTWEYQLDNSEWVTVPANQGIVRRPYDGKTVTAVRYTMNVSGITYGNGTYTIDATGATTTASRYGSYAQKPLFYVTGCDHLGEERYHTNGEIDYSSGKNGTPVFEGLKNVGSYGFSANEGDLGYFYSLYTTNGSLTIQIVPQDVTVTIDDKSITYGDTPATLTSDAPADAGVTLTKLGGVGVGKHTILGTVDKSVATSKNYNITFKNQGVYEITQRAVTVIVNNAEAEYGEKKYTLNKDENKTAVKGTLPLSDDGSKDADGFDVDTDGDRVDSNGNKIYNGGWRYAGDSATDTGKQFIAADVNKTKHEYPIELSCSAVETESATYIAVDDYDIIAKSVNPNYNLTILNADGTPAASGNGKGTFSVTEATIKVMKGSEYKTLKGGDAKAYDSEVYKGNNVTVSIPTASFTGTDTKTYPTGAVILKGDGAVSGIIYRIFNSDGKNVTTPSVTKPTETPAADDATFWGSSDTTVTDADTYTVYAKISATHHEDLVYVFTYELTGQKTKLTLIAKWGTNNVATNVTDNSVTVDASKAVYDGTTKLTLDKTYVNTDANSTNCPLLVYYKNTAPKSDTDTAWKWGAWTSTLTRLETTDTTSPKYKYSADKKFHEDYGTTEEPKDGGTYTVTVLVDPDSKGFTIDGLNSLTVTVNAKEVDIPKGPTTNPVYNGTEWEAFSLSYNTAGVNPKSWASNEGYEDLTKGTTTAGTPNTTQKYKATNAGKYAVIFELTNKDNYKWKDKTGNEATADQKVELTLDKKAVTVTFNPPKEDASMKWTWKPGDYTDKYITYTIDES